MMKRRGVVVFLLIATQQVLGQQPLYTGTKTPYQVSVTHTIPAPAGFQPVWLNHVGRHGARFLTKPGSDTGLLTVLNNAGSANALTRTGKKVKAMTERFLGIEKDNYEWISLLGKQEQAAIAARMLRQYPSVFTGRGLNLQVTHKVRTQQSADAFLSGIGACKGPESYALSQEASENVLRFYDMSPAYLAFKKGNEVTRRIDSLQKDPRTAAVATQVAARLFKADWLKQQEAQHPGFSRAITEDLYDLYSVQFSIPLEMKQQGYSHDDINFAIAFKSTELAWLDFLSSAEDYLEKGAGTNAMGIQTRIAVPLLVDFINTTDKAISQPQQSDAALRFTHAEAIAPFAALLGIPEASTCAASIFQYDAHWKAAGIIPLSANIQWILYSNGKEYLVKVLLNEREVALPIATSQYPYYRWNDVKTYCIGILNQLHVQLTDNMHEYLLQVK